MGYASAGYDVVGVDINDHAERYPFEFHQGNAVSFIREHGREFDLIHTSPPCQGQIAITKGNRGRSGWVDTHVNLIPATREVCEWTGVPYVIENGPSEYLRSDVVLCGLTFGLDTFRHRFFELGHWVAPAPRHYSHKGHLTIGWRHGCLRTPAHAREECPLHRKWCEGTVYGVYGKGGRKPSVREAQRALGIHWTDNLEALNEAIPPAYTHYLGRAYRDALRRV